MGNIQNRTMLPEKWQPPVFFSHTEFPSVVPCLSLFSLQDVVCGMEGLEGPERKLRDGALGSCQLWHFAKHSMYHGKPTTCLHFLEVMGPHINGGFKTLHFSGSKGMVCLICTYICFSRSMVRNGGSVFFSPHLLIVDVYSGQTTTTTPATSRF